MSNPTQNAFSALGGTNNAFKPNTSTPLFGPTTPAGSGATGGTTGVTNAFGGGGGNAFGGFETKRPAGGLFGGGGGDTSSAPAVGTSLFGGFGAGVNATSTSSAPTGGLGLFGAKPPEQSASVSVPTTSTTTNPTPATGGFTLGGASTPSAPAPTPKSSTAAPAPSNFFSVPPKPAEPSASSPAPGGSLFGSAFSLGKKPETPTTSTAAPSTTTPAIPSLFGQPPAKKDDESSKGPAPPATQTGGLFGQSAGVAGFNAGSSLFGQKPTESKDAPTAPAKDGEKKDGAAPLNPLFGAATTGNTGNAATSATPAASTTTPSISVPPPSTLRGKTIEEIVNKWSTDLETHVREFSRLAGEVAVWDRALIDNGNTIASLFQHVLLAEREQNDIEQSLKHVEDQQKELAATLEVYEKATGEIFDSQGGGLRALDVGPADAERDKHYTLAADLNANLDDLSRSLMQMIDSVNTLSETNVETDNASKGEAPLEQIAQILSSHLESLQWIDTAVHEVENKVTDVEKRIREASAGNSAANSVSGANGTSIPRPRGFGLR